MIAITVDDERPMLKALTDIVEASSDIEKVYDFSVCSSALEWIGQNRSDVAFLDINMRGMGGLALAEKIAEIQPDCKIVFCTGYEEYALNAIRLRCSGYLMKPISPEAVQKEINKLGGVSHDTPPLAAFHLCTYSTSDSSTFMAFLGIRNRRVANRPAIQTTQARLLRGSSWLRMT